MEDLVMNQRQNDEGSDEEMTEDTLARAQQLMEEGEIDKAVAILVTTLADEGVEKDKEYQSEVLFNLGVCYFMGKGLLNKAVEYFNECIKINPSHQNALFNRAAVYLQQGNGKDAANDLTEYIKLTPDDPDAFQNRGFARLQGGDTDGALEDFNSSLKLHPDNYGGLNNRANILMNVKKEYNQAMEDLNMAIRLLPNDYIAHKNRGHLKVLMGDITGALIDFQHSMKLARKENRAEIQMLIDELKHKK